MITLFIWAIQVALVAAFFYPGFEQTWNAILMKALSSDPHEIVRGIFLMVAIVGILSSALWPLLWQLVESLPHFKGRRARENDEALRRKYEKVCAKLHDEEEWRALVEPELKNLRRLNEERLNFDRYHDVRVRGAMKGKPE